MMKGRMLQRLIKKILLASVFLFSACDLNSLFNPAWDEPVNEFLKEYTETAGIMAMELDGSYPVNSEGITCLPSTGDRKIKFYLRNPQNYTLNVSMETEDSVNTNVTVKQDENDKSLITVLYPKNYLLNKDKDTADKNISGIIKIVEPKSGRSFADYSVSLHANSLPPSIENAVFQLDSADINNANYVICFYFPELNTIENGIHQDVNVLLVNGNKKYVKGTTVYSDEECESVDTAFTTVKPDGLTALEDSGGYQFAPDSAPDDYIPLYYKTNIKPSTDEIRYSFILQDKEGLKGNETGISNKAGQLNAPSIEVEADKSYAVDEDTGFYTLLISHDGLCEDGTSAGTVTINYTVKGGSSAEITGSSEGSVSIKLPKGTYEVSAAAVKKFFITSDKSSVTNVKITRSPVFYVSEKGNDRENTGSKLSPYRTIQKAVDAFEEGIGSDYESSAECKIYVMTDLTPPEDFDFSSNSNSFISIPNAAYNISILGYDGIRTVNAGRSSGNEGRVLTSLCSGSLTLSNINLTGGYTSENGGGIYNKGSLILSGVTVSGNKAGAGAGVYCESASRLTITGKNTIYDNMIFDGTKQSNIYLPVSLKINIDGDISGSKIGVNVPWQSDDEGAPQTGIPAAFTSGYGYGKTNSSYPESIFYPENDYSITADDSGEAAFAKGGAGIYTALDFVFNLTMDRANENGKYTFYAGHKKVFTVTPEVKIGSTKLTYVQSTQTLKEVSSTDKITWSATLSCGSVLTGNMGVEVDNNKITIPKTLSYPETFILNVTAEYMGVAHSKEFILEGIEAPVTAGNIDAINSIIDNSSESEIEVLVTNQLSISDEGSFSIDSGKTLTLIRSDDIDSYSMLKIGDGCSFGKKDGGRIILDGDNIKASGPLVSTETCNFYNITIKNACNENGSGGGLVCGRTNYLRMQNCKFEDCYALNGGAIWIHDDANNDGNGNSSLPNGIVGCTFKNCYAKSYGGAIYCAELDNNRTVNITDCSFTNCIADEAGNILYAQKSAWYYIVNISNSGTSSSGGTTSSSSLIIDD